MILRPGRIVGAFLIETERAEDERGHVTRTWCEREFAAHGIVARWVQSIVAVSRKAGTLRGIHCQAPPHQEAKLVRCSRGAIYDVIVDLRRGSLSFLEWTAVELSAANGLLLFVPEGVGHGYQTLVDDSETTYLLSASYEPAAARGVRWDDPRLGIAWPECAERVISARDRSIPDIVP